MRLGEGTPEREPVVFNLDEVDPQMRDDAARLAASFAFGRLKFDDDLHTAVAMSHGIDINGVLDARMVEAVEQTQEYLAGRNGQPVVVVDTFAEKAQPASVILYDGYIAQLGDAQPLVGLHPDRQDRRNMPGIQVVGGYTEFHSYFHQEGILATQWLTPRDVATIPLGNREIIFGIPGGEGLGEDRVARQEILAGEDIVPWIVSELGDDKNGYHFYRNVVFSLIKGDEFEYDFPVLDSLLTAPFAESLKTELEVLRSIKTILEDYQDEVEDYQRMLAGAKGRANVALRSIRMANEGLMRFMPQCNTSYPAMIAASLDDPYGAQTKERIQAADGQEDPLKKAVNHGIRTGKI